MTIETKFNPDQKVWIMSNNKPVTYSIKDIKASTFFFMGAPNNRKVLIEYTVDENDALFPESAFYASKKDLLESL